MLHASHSNFLRHTAATLFGYNLHILCKSGRVAGKMWTPFGSVKSVKCLMGKETFANRNRHPRFGVLIAVLLKVQGVSDVSLCWLVINDMFRRRVKGSQKYSCFSSAT